jgi:hypothetical protein
VCYGRRGGGLQGACRLLLCDTGDEGTLCIRYQAMCSPACAPAEPARWPAVRDTLRSPTAHIGQKGVSTWMRVGHEVCIDCGCSGTYWLLLAQKAASLSTHSQAYIRANQDESHTGTLLSSAFAGLLLAINPPTPCLQHTISPARSAERTAACCAARSTALSVARSAARPPAAAAQRGTGSARQVSTARHSTPQHATCTAWHRCWTHICAWDSCCLRGVCCVYTNVELPQSVTTHHSRRMWVVTLH